MKQFNCRLVARISLTSDVSLYRFESEDGMFSFSPGQFISFVFMDPVSSLRVVRSYSIARAHEPTEVGIVSEGCVLRSRMFDLIIISVAGGKGTTILKNLPIGSVLRVVGPAGNLTLKMTYVDTSPLVFCANSTGIAPFCSMLQYLARANTYPETRVFWGLKTMQDVYFGEEFEVYKKLWADKGSIFDMKICLSRETILPEVAGSKSSILTLGRIQASVEKLPIKQYHFYICGGKSFVLDTKTFISAKFPDSKIFSERFN